MHRVRHHVKIRLDGRIVIVVQQDILVAQSNYGQSIAVVFGEGRDCKAE